jgi:hypothetical protein
MDGFCCEWTRCQHPCALSGEQCGGTLQSLTEGEWSLLRSRCAIAERMVHDSSVVCKRHANEWVHRYKPTRCAACPAPLSSSGWRLCPEWLREQLGAEHGATVHERPCYKEAVAAKKQQVADTQPSEVKQEIQPSQPTFHIDVSDHTHCNQASCLATEHSPTLLLCAGRPGRRNASAATSDTRRDC